MKLTKEKMMEVVSPEQIKSLVRITSILDKSKMTFEIELLYTDKGLIDPFDVRIHLKTKDIDIWLYSDGADANGSLEFRFETDDFDSKSELFSAAVERISNYCRLQHHK
jgi:hypothetical protein